MKYIITHKQYQLLKEQTEEVLRLPNVDYFGGWDNLQKYFEIKKPTSRGEYLISNIRIEHGLWEDPNVD